MRLHKRTRQRKRMIEIKSNLNEVSRRLYRRLLNVSTPENLDKLSREIGFTLAAHMRERIHEKGQDSSGGQIGVYSPAYLRERQRKSKKHPQRTSDPKVILSLTRQMEDDFTTGIENPEPTKTSQGYGVGFKNNSNFKKSQWNEERYKKPIYKTTQEEKTLVRTVAEDFINRQIQKI